MFKARRSQTLLAKLKANIIKVVNVPPSCTDQLQPLDVTPNKIYKDELKSAFQNYFSDCVADKLKNNKSVTKIDLRTSAIKPIHAKWLMKFHAIINSKPEMIKSAFEQCGIYS